MGKNILIISYSPLHRDPRILRQINSLEGDYNLQAIGLTNPNIYKVDFFDISFAQHPKTLYEKVQLGLRIWFWQSSALRHNLKLDSILKYKYRVPDIIIANDWNGLYSATVLKKEKKWNAQIYFDAHEFFPKYRNSWFWKLFEKPLITYVFKKCRNSFKTMSTVCPSLAKMYEDYFHFESNKVHVITNAPDFESDLIPQVVGDKVKIIHHGCALKERQIEKMIDMMAYLPEDKYELYFMLVLGDKEYYEKLVQRASKYQNIHFLTPVPFAQIPSFTNQFDVGLFILNNDLINYKYALPNKFFEFVQARLAIAIGDSYEMKQYVKKYDLGIAADDNTPEALAEKFIKLTKEDIMKYKQNAHMYARELSAEPNITELKSMICELTSK